MRKIRCGDVSGNSTGKSTGIRVARTVAMTTSLLDQCASTLEARCRRGDDAALLAHLGAAGVVLPSPPSALGIARRCHDPGARQWTTASLCALLDLVARDEVAILTVLVALAPVLTRITGRLTRDQMAHDDAESVVVVAALEALSSGAGQRRADDPLGALAQAVWIKSRTALRALRRYRALHVPADAGEATAPPSTNAVGEDATLLAWAVSAGVLAPHEARLVGETRVAGRPLGEVAFEWEMGTEALRSRRRRAETRLRAALVAEGLVTERLVLRCAR